jgi:hypothetical protein
MGLHLHLGRAWMNGSGKPSNTVTARAGITAAGAYAICAAQGICQYMPQGEQLTCHIAKQRNTQTQTVKIRWHSSGLLPLTQTRLVLSAYLDYLLKPYGRGWRCDRQRWRKYSKPTIHGAPGGDWLHIEISPAMADSPALVRQAFQRVFTELPH